MSELPVRVLMHVQHLLGTGHTRRVAAIARALAAGGAEVLLASGGMPVDGLDTGAARLLQLPPARSADATYAALLDANGAPVDEAWRRRRSSRLLEAVDAFDPDVVVLETYPFGRRLLRFELEPLLDVLRTRRSPPCLCVSVRDILEPPRKPGRAEQTVECVLRDIDLVLVHGDPRLVNLAHSFPLAALVESRVRYTGYVLDAPRAAGDEHVASNGDDEVLVSAGGGAAGMELLRCALAAASCLPGVTRRWRMMVAPAVAEADFRELRARARAGVVVERNRRDFRALLAGCRVSVSQAGYNTLIEALQAALQSVAEDDGARAVVIASMGRVWWWQEKQSRFCG